MRLLSYLMAGVLGMSTVLTPAYAAPPVVLELFTSQGCSSCPPADQLLKRLVAQDRSLVALSFHVHYWDYLGWKDPYSSTANTERQRNYAAALGDNQVYTPELVVNGERGVVGSNESAVSRAIAAARQQPQQASVLLTRGADPTSLDVRVEPTGTPTTEPADIWLIHYAPYAKTDVARGENGGRSLENINNVRTLARLAAWDGRSARYAIKTSGAGDGVAVLVQKSGLGRILGAAFYE